MLLLNGGFPGIFLFETSFFFFGRNEHTQSTFHAKSEDLVATRDRFLREKCGHVANIQTDQRRLLFLLLLCQCVYVLIDMVGVMGCINVCWLFFVRNVTPILGAFRREVGPRKFQGSRQVGEIL